MKSGPAAVLLMIVIAAAADAARIPPPASAQCRISCVVEQRAEWKTEPQAFNDLAQPQKQAPNPVLITNSPAGGYESESIVEIDIDGQFHSNNCPIEIIVHAKAQQDQVVKTVTACWKI